MPARPSSCTLTSFDRWRAREACGEWQISERMHSGAEGCGCVGGGGGEEGTAKSDGETRRLDKNVVFSTVKIKYFTVV